MDITIDGDKLLYRRPILNGTVLSLMAENIRQGATGLHAKLTIRMNTTPLAWSNFNVERDEDRLRLANSAYKQFSPQSAKEYSKEYLKADLDEFCLEMDGKRLEMLQAEEMVGELIPEGFRYVVKPWVVREGGTIVFAPPGAGKSYLAILIAVCVDAGLMRFWEVAPCKVLLINLERGQRSVAHRLHMVNNCLELDPRRTLLTLNARGKRFSSIYENAKRAVRDNDVGLVILDSISRTGYGDLTENEPMNAVADALNALCPSWLALAHSPRNDATHVYGSQMQDAAADIMVSLSSQSKQVDSKIRLGLKITMTKANDIGGMKPEYLALEFEGDYLTGVMSAKDYEFPRLMQQEKADLDELIIQYLIEVRKADATTIANALNQDRSHVSRILSSDDRFVALPREGKTIPYTLKWFMNKEEPVR